MAEHFDTIVIGGGIAGVAALAELSRHGSALLLEREPSLAAHASGRNAAIFRPLEHDETTAALARRSLEILGALTTEPILKRLGLLLVARDARVIDAAIHQAIDTHTPHAVLEQSQCVDRVTALGGGDVAAGLWLPDAGVLDIHRMLTVLTRAARDRGAVIRPRQEVAAIEPKGHAGIGVALADGTQIGAQRVVLAAGAWCEPLARACGSTIALTPIRRHLMQLKVDSPVDPKASVVWQLDPDHELYFRPESGGVLASPCDAAPIPAASMPASTTVDPGALEMLATKLANTAPSLAKARVQQAWACLRTFASDGELLVGADPALPGLYWMAGLGGRGMAVAVGAAEVLGSLVASSRSDELSQRVSPARLRGRSRSMLDNR